MQNNRIRESLKTINPLELPCRDADIDITISAFVNRVLICLTVSIVKYLVRHACIEIANRKVSKNMQNIRLFSICSVTVMLSDLTILHFLAFLDEFFRTSYIDSY